MISIVMMLYLKKVQLDLPDGEVWVAMGIVYEAGCYQLVSPAYCLTTSGMP